MNSRELPEGWKATFLPQVAEINRTNRNPNNDAPEETFHYIDISSIDGETGLITQVQEILGKDAPSRARRVIQENDVIISTVRPYLRGFAIIPEEYSGEICSTGFVVLSARSNILPQYLYYFARSNDLVNELTRRMKGAMYPAVNISDVKEIEIPLPSLEEQRQIVAILEQAEELRRLRAEADRLTEKILPSAFIEIFGDPRENPKRWETVMLGEIAQVTKGKKPNQLVTLGNEGLPYLEAAFLRVESSPQIVPNGDLDNVICAESSEVLILWDGANAGDVFMALKGVVASTMAKVSCMDESILPGFLYYCLLCHSPYMKSTTSGSTVPHVRSHAVRSLSIPYPPLREQQHFVELVEDLQVIQQRQAEAHKLLDSSYQSLSVQAFTGELTASWREEQKALIAERQAVILTMLSRLAQQNRRQVLITALMKYLFLLQMEGRAKEFYRYVPYKYGPFARELYADLEDLKGRGLITVTATDDKGERTEIALQIEQGKEIAQMVQKLPKDVWKDAEGIVDLYGELSLKELLDFVYAEYPDYAIRSER